MSLRKSWLFILPVLTAFALAQSGFFAGFRNGLPPVTPQTPGEKFAATFGEAMKAQGNWMAAFNAAQTDAERARLFDDRRQLEATSKSLVELATSLGDRSPLAVESLVWVMTHLPESEIGREAAALLLRDFGTSPLLQPICTRLAESRSELAVETLRKLTETTTIPAVLGSAELALGELLKVKAEQSGWSHPQQAQAWSAEAESLFAKSMTNSPETTSQSRNQTGFDASPRDQAEANLREIQTRRVGKPAPEIEGPNLRGETMRLSDHRGRVVVVSFWGNWCSLCVSMLPHDRELVERMKGRPFTFLGVNSDNDPSIVLKKVEEGSITWNSWSDGGETRGGEIAEQWNVKSLPCDYIIDAKGIIRHKVGPRPDEHDTVYIKDADGKIVNRWKSRAEEISTVVEALVREAEAEAASSASL